jgi:hypothetical protein
MLRGLLVRDLAGRRGGGKNDIAGDIIVVLSVPFSWVNTYHVWKAEYLIWFVL